MWDERIDEAAREWTAGLPSGDFTARVIERIERDASHQVEAGWRGRRWKWAAPLAAAAALFVGVAMYRSKPEEITTRPSSSSGLQADLTRRPSLSSGLQADHATDTRPSTGPGPRADLTERPSSSSGLHVDLADLADVDQIVVEPMQIAPIEIAAIDNPEPVVAPLVLITIEMPALDQ